MKRDFLSRMRARKAAVRHAHPSRGLQLVLVSGEGSATTARLLSEIFRESGNKTAVFTPRGSWIEDVPYTPSYRSSADALQRALAACKKQRCKTAIIAVDTELEQTGVIETLSIDLGLITELTTASQVVLAQPLRYMVVPAGSDTDLTKVAPHHTITYGEDITADAHVKSIQLYRKGTEVSIVIDHQTPVELATYLVGTTNALRVAAAVAAAYVMGAPVEDLPEGVARLETITGNFQDIPLDAPYHVVVDEASSTEMVRQLVESAKTLSKRRILVVCDQSVDPDALAAIRPDVDRLTVVKGHSGEATDQADSLSDAVSLTLRGAKLDDLVLLIGEELAEQVDEEQTRGARLVSGGSD